MIHGLAELHPEGEVGEGRGEMVHAKIEIGIAGKREMGERRGEKVNRVVEGRGKGEVGEARREER